MSENKFKVGDKVRVVDTVIGDINRVEIGETCVVKSLYEGDGAFVDFGRDIEIKHWTNRDDAYLMWNAQLELMPFEVPASPFYVRARLTGTEFRIEVDGLHYTATDIATGSKYGPGNGCLTRNIPLAFNDGTWKLIDRPAPAVDPVTAAAAEVQRLLREQQAAVKAGDEADNVAAKAAEHRRSIGKALNEAQRALDKAMCDAAGVEYQGR